MLCFHSAGCYNRVQDTWRKGHYGTRRKTGTTLVTRADDAWHEMLEERVIWPKIYISVFLFFVLFFMVTVLYQGNT